MAGSDDTDFVVFAEQLFQRLGQVCDRRGGRLLHEDIARTRVFECVQHEINRLIERHQKTRHLRVGNGQRLAGQQLVDEEGNHRAPRPHDVAIARGAENSAVGPGEPRLRDHQFFHHGLGDAHGIDWINSLVGTENHTALHAIGNGRPHDILDAQDVRANRLHRVELTGGHLLQRGGAEDIVDADQCIMDAVVLPHIPYVELELLIAQFKPHVFLFFFVAAENANLREIEIEQAAQNGIAERARASGDQEYLVFERHSGFSFAIQTASWP